jgi:type VI secretion system Hcp family effector
MRSTLVVAAAAVLGLAAGTPAGAFSMIASFETQQGRLDCGNVARGQEGTQVLMGVSDEFAIGGPDTASADPGGALLAKPLVVLKEVDRCSPPLFRALVARERLSRVEIRLLNRAGAHFFTIRLEGAQVTRIARTVRQHGLQEEVALAFEVIELVDELSGASAAHVVSP